MSGSLAGLRIFVTRPERDAGSLADLLRAEGAEPIQAPAITVLPAEDIGPLDDALREAAAGGFAWMCVTSPAGAEAIGGRLAELGIAPPLPLKVAAVGAATANAVRDLLGMEAALVPGEFTTRALGREFPSGRDGGRVLLPRVDVAPPGLEETIAEKGWIPVRVTAYRTRHPDSLPLDARRALDAGEVDALVFTSSSTVEGFVHQAGVRSEPKVIVIGPTTASRAEELGFAVDAVAEPHTIEGIVEALKDLFAVESRP